MREILFRGKRIDNGEWVEGVPVKTHIGTFIVFEENPHYCNQYGYMEICELAMVDPETVGQYTELNANGKMIFEGDIVKGIFLFGEQILSVVKFSEGSFGLAWQRGNVEEFSPFTGMCNVEYEVISNIHDNKTEDFNGR